MPDEQATMTCPNCMEQIVPVEDTRTPHFDRETKTFSCPEAAAPSVAGTVESVQEQQQQ